MDLYRAEMLAKWVELLAQEEVSKTKSLEDKLAQVTGKKTKAKVKKELDATAIKAEKLCNTVVTGVYNTNLH